jgi:uncharacterized protein
MKRLSFASKLIVVTGASSGLGREIARLLACEHGADLLIAARRRQRLEELKADIESRCASRVSLCAVDLASPEGPAALSAAAAGIGDVYGLVNCAGATYYGWTLDAPAGEYERMIALNLVAPLQVTMRFLPGFIARGSGAILTVTSIGAFVPMPFQSCYAATKHGLQAFMEGCAIEYRGRGVTFTTFAPGGIDTEMISLSGIDAVVSGDNPVNQSPARAARIAVNGWRRGKPVIVPGLLYKTSRMLQRLAPRWLVARFMYRLYEPPSGTAR